MIIVINTCSLLNGGTTEKAVFFKNCIHQIVKNNPNHSFILISDSNKDIVILPPNLKEISIAPTTKNLFRWKFWYAYSLPKILKKHKADFFINIDCISVKNVSISQCLMVRDADTPANMGFGKKKPIEFLNRANLLITHSEMDKEAIAKKYTNITEKLFVIPLATNKYFDTLDYEEKENIKEKYTSGKEYFLCIGELSTEHNLIILLKAFSFFKKRQKSNMQLLLTTNKVLPDNAFIKSLANYKYKAEVKLFFDLPQQEYVKIMAAAYVFVWPAVATNSYMSVLNAMQCGVPVIVNECVLLKEICGNASLFTIGGNFENLADKMMLLFKDENLRKLLIEKGLQQSSKYSLTNAASLFWQYLLNCEEISS